MSSRIRSPSTEGVSPQFAETQSSTSAPVERADHVCAGDGCEQEKCRKHSATEDDAGVERGRPAAETSTRARSRLRTRGRNFWEESASPLRKEIGPRSADAALTLQLFLWSLPPVSNCTVRIRREKPV
ncbi:unnamed protein product [Heligmosomoides polygyrus]|uniref:Uncharacterized protein n=1 Tax=Heligmosomoides polygyrus TaxID=6339 RepID=A0A183FGK8_HELPZ|nr:unnamed protein product [Heligmosomoides polygyrus]